MPNPVEPPPAPIAATELNLESVSASNNDFVVILDRRTLFINMQYPGDGADDSTASNGFTGTWLGNTGADAAVTGEFGNRPRSATIMITRDDGGLIGSDFEPV